MKRKASQYFVERCENYSQGFNKCMKKRRVNQRVGLHGKIASSSRSQAEILPVAEGTK